MTQTTISLAAMERLLKSAGAGRVAEDAKEELKKSLELYAERIGKQAATLAAHAGRKTVQAVDVELSVKALSRD